ncbi:MAG TPA: hypothetical protein VGD60_18335 [Candidatus Acidoferrales bacterium]
MSPDSKNTQPLVQISSEPERDEEYRGPFYELHQREIRFPDAVKKEHTRLRSSLLRYMQESRFFVGLTAPLIYGCIIPFVLIDIFISIYQWFSFPLYGIPKVKRSDFIVFDRGKLCYLNLLERINCAYCSYGNGVMAYVVEVAARTEQHWCPIRHAHRIMHPHDRYAHFLPYGDAVAYRAKLEEVRTDFKDVNAVDIASER